MARSRDTPEGFDEYYREISDGCGCAELWEYMSERRHGE